MEADNKPKGNPHHDNSADCGNKSCTIKVPLDDTCCNIDEVRDAIKLLVLNFVTTLKSELDLFDLEIVELLDQLKCPEEVDVKVCLKVKCDEDDDKGLCKGDDQKV